MKVRITKCRHSIYWYSNRIGDVFEVASHNASEYFVRQNRGGTSGVDKSDCEIIDTFTKSDLKTGMVVEFANGERGLVSKSKRGDRYILCLKQGMLYVGDYYDNLMFSGFENSHDGKGYNIDFVYQPSGGHTIECFEEKNEYKPIWQRPQYWLVSDDNMQEIMYDFKISMSKKARYNAIERYKTYFHPTTATPKEE